MPSRRRTASSAAPPTAPGRPEHWELEVGASDVAQLTIPADAQRERVFEIACSMVVRRLDSAAEPWHEMRVTVDGALEWSRRIPTANPGSTDTLDYRFRRTAGVGQPLRLTVHSRVQGAQRVALRIEADET